MPYSTIVQADISDPDDLLVPPLWELTLLALQEGLDLHRSSEEQPENLPFTLVMSGLDAALAMLVRHPLWARRLAELHEGTGVDAAMLDALVERHPLER